jgi:hypothetical protein
MIVNSGMLKQAIQMFGRSVDRQSALAHVGTSA